MHIIFCNLDPHWEFITRVHNHCLDVYADPRIEFWHIGATGDAKPDCWGDWPRRIAREHLLAAVLEAGQVLPETESLWLLVNTAAPDPELERELATLTNQTWWRRCTAVLALATDEETAPALHVAPPRQSGEPSPLVSAVANAESTLWRHTFLLTSDPRQRLYSLRLLGELFQQHDDRDNPLLPQNGVFRLSLEHRPQTSLSDCVMQHWPQKASDLLDMLDEVEHPRLDSWLQKVEDTERAIFKLLGANPDQLQQLEQFLDERLDDQAVQQGATLWSNELIEPAQQRLHWRTPWFHDPKLPETLRLHLNEFTDALDRTLIERYASLHQTQQPNRTRQFHAEQHEHRADLARHHAWTLGISEVTINQLKHDHAELAHYRSAIRRRVEKLAAFLRHRIEPSVRRRAPVFGDSEYRYRRQWLEADVALHEARRTAKTAARRLVSRAGFWGGLAAITGLALLPALILRWPTLAGAGGIKLYFNTTTWWGPDCAWTALFALIYLIFALHQVYQRHRRLRIAQHGLCNAAEELWRQNLEILSNLFRYQDHSQAQRLLTALDEHCERLLEELTQTQNDLNTLRRDLQRQLDFYQTLVPPIKAGPGLSNGFNTHESRTDSPRHWLHRCLEAEHWRLPEQKIAVSGIPDVLKSRYLAGCEEIRIREVSLYS